MAKHEVAILGGGIAGLSAAYQLSKTPQLREKYHVTVYQLGWRLGGKLASGRDALGRNLEHGLHVWFGCYDNTFRMLQEIYSVREVAAGAPLRSWTDAVKGQNFTPFGYQFDGRWRFWPLTWANNADTPGDGRLKLTLWGAITDLTGLVRSAVDTLIGAPADAASPSSHIVEPLTPESLWADIPRAADAPFDQELFGLAVRNGISIGDPIRAQAERLANAAQLGLHDVAAVAHFWALSLGEDHTRFGLSHPEQILGLLRWLKETVANVRMTGLFVDRLALLRELLDIFQAFVVGLWRDMLIPDKPFEALDAEDFRAWLVRHGADPQIVATSSLVRIIYDAPFQYLDGDPERPSYAAGTAAGVIVRLITTYKGAMLWELQAGMGEAFIAPIYEVLCARNVAFRFFQKVTKLELDPEKKNVQRILIDRQTNVITGDYEPTFLVEGMRCWPSEPDWNQLKDGASIQAAGVNFESHWCSFPPTGRDVLEYQTHFDTVVLAISLGAYKPLNDEPGLCDELIAANPDFAAFAQNINIVPSQGVQFWCDATLEQLGWSGGKPATVAGPECLDIWADMTQVLKFETWPQFAKPKSLHYLTGTFKTNLYRARSVQFDVPAAAAAALRTQTIDWLDKFGQAMWSTASDANGFRWEVLTDPENRAGVARLQAQFLRANIDPTECCVGSAAGTTQFRLHPTQAGFCNLVLAGEATRHGFNTSSVEGAVMSGMAAARAISGEPATIVGYEFLQRPPSQWIDEVSMDRKV